MKWTRTDDLQKVLAATPWSKLLVPLAIALLIVAAFLYYSLRG